MSLQVVITADSEGYYLADGDTECDESVGWGEVIELGDTKYDADLSEDGADVLLYELTELQEGSGFTVASEEGDDEDEEDETLPVESASD